MRVLLIAIGSAGDVHPLIGIGLQLKARGHSVTVYTNGYFQSLVERVGLGFLEMESAEKYLSEIAHPDIWHPTRGLRHLFTNVIKPLIRQVFTNVAEFNVPGETVLAAPTMALGARLANEKLAIPFASILLQPTGLRSIEDMPILPGVPPPWMLPRFARNLVYQFADSLVLDRTLCPELNALRGELGLKPIRRPMDQWIYSPQRILGLFPAWFAPVPHDWPSQTRLTGFPLYDERGVSPTPPEVETFLAEGDRPIVFTPGSAMMHAREFFVQTAEACRRLGCRGILLTRHTEQIPDDLPPGVRHFDFVPLSALLPRAAALVHHGGIGTSAQALAAGVPQLILDLGAFDQPDNLRRLKRLGVADSIPRGRFFAPLLVKKLSRLLGDRAVKTDCKVIAAKFAGENGAAAACGEIEALAEHLTPRRSAV